MTVTYTRNGLPVGEDGLESLDMQKAQSLREAESVLKSFDSPHVQYAEISVRSDVSGNLSYAGILFHGSDFEGWCEEGNVPVRVELMPSGSETRLYLSTSLPAGIMFHPGCAAERLSKVLSMAVELANQAHQAFKDLFLR